MAIGATGARSDLGQRETRSGSSSRNVAPVVVSRSSACRHARPQARPRWQARGRCRLCGRALEGSEHVGSRRSRRHARASVADLDEDPAAVAPRLDADFAKATLAALPSPCCSIAWTALRARLLKMRKRCSGSASTRSARPYRRSSAILPSRGRPRPSPPPRRGASGASVAAGPAPRPAERERRVAEVDGAIERSDQLRREPLHGRVGDAVRRSEMSWALASMLRRS